MNPRSSYQTWIFGATILLSAFLLFQIQPMISKIILPWFGGGPAVWTAAMLFFQILLLGGYGYAHIINRLSLPRQAFVHLVTLISVVAWLILLTLFRGVPILPDASLKPDPQEFPVWQVLSILALSVGIPYLLLSTTSSLVQSWYSGLEKKGSPYVFYALSNAASLIALISYPLLVEPLWPVRQQASFWTIGFAIYLGLTITCIIILAARTRTGTRNQRTEANDVLIKGSVSITNQPPSSEETNQDLLSPTPRNYLVWIGLACCSSVMLLAVTNEITQDVASVPFLWVLPLSLYLLSFVLAFNDRLRRLNPYLAIITMVSLSIGYFTLGLPNTFTIVQLISGNALMLFAICLLCHQTLYILRPHPRYLTAFYLMLSIGGALGGVFVSLIAPAVFPDYWEYPLGLIATAGIITSLAFQRKGTWYHFLRFPFLILTVVLAGFLGETIYSWMNGSLGTYRNFYGVLRIREITYENTLVYNLVHGRIIHGSQAANDEFHRSQPTRYYSPSTGIGLAFNYNIRRSEGQPLRAGMVGLGIGTIAAYGQPGDTIRFYEINPIVPQIAQDERYFSFLNDSPAKIEIILGDARLSMEKEQQNPAFPKYDILAIDAFSGDSIPTHLINREATALYLSLLKEDGILAFHISNRYLNLEPVVASLAEEYQLNSGKISSGSIDWLGTSSTWILLSPSPVAIGTEQLTAARQPIHTRPGLPIWTDEYSNLFQVLR